MTARDEGYLEPSALQDVPEQEDSLFSWHNIGYEGNVPDSFVHSAQFSTDVEECDSEDNPNLILLYVHKQSDYLPHSDEYGGFRFLETIEEETSDDLRSESDDSGSARCQGSVGLPDVRDQRVCWMSEVSESAGSQGSAEDQTSEFTDNRKTFLDLVNGKKYLSEEENNFLSEDALPISLREAFPQRPQVLRQFWGFLEPKDDISQFSLQCNSEECDKANESPVSECSVTFEDEKGEDKVSDSEGSDLSEFSSMEYAVLAEFSFEDADNSNNGWNAQSDVEPQKSDVNGFHLFRNKNYSELKENPKRLEEAKATYCGENNSLNCLYLEPSNDIEKIGTVAQNSDFSFLIQHQSSGSLTDYSENRLSSKHLHKCDVSLVDGKSVPNAVSVYKNVDFARTSNKNCDVDQGNANSNAVCETSHFSEKCSSSLQRKKPTDDSYVIPLSKKERDISPPSKLMKQCLVLEGEEISAGEYCNWKNQDFSGDNRFYLESFHTKDDDRFIKQHDFQELSDYQDSKFEQDGLNESDCESFPRLEAGSVKHRCLTNAMGTTIITAASPKEIERRKHSGSSEKKQVLKSEDEAYITNSELRNNVENPQQNLVVNDLVRTTLSLQRVKEDSGINIGDSECVLSSFNCDNNWSPLSRACLARGHQGGSFKTLLSRTNDVSQLLHVQNSDGIPLESPLKSSLMGRDCENVPKNRCASNSVFQKALVRQLAEELFNERTTHASTGKREKDRESDIYKNERDINTLSNEQTTHAPSEKHQKECISVIYENNTDLNMLLNEQTTHASTRKHEKDYESDIYKNNTGIIITTSCMEGNNSVSGQSYCRDLVTPKISTTDLQDSDDETFALASSVTMETNNNCYISSGHITQSSESVLDTCSTPEKWFHPFTGEMNKEENILQPKSENDTQSICQSEQRKRKARESARGNTPKNARGEEWEMIKEPHETLGVSENVIQTYFNNGNVRDKNMPRNENAISRDKLERSLIINPGVRCTDCFERVGKSAVNNFSGVERQKTIDVATKDQHVDSEEIGLGTSINQTTSTAQKCDEKQTMKENRHPFIMGDPAETEVDVTQQTDDVFARKEDDTLCIKDDLKTSSRFGVQQEEAIFGDLFYDQNKRTICSNEYLLEPKNREPPEGSEEPYLSFHDDQQQIQQKFYNNSLYIEYQERRESGFDYSETGSTQKDVEGSLNTDGNNINNQVSQTSQSLFPHSFNEVHCNSDDIVTNRTRVEFTGKWDVAPSLEASDNYNAILGFADDSFETRSVQGQRQRELYDLNSIENNTESLPRGTCPCRSKSNAGTANVEAHDLRLRADVRNVLRNLERHQDEEKRERSLFDGDTEKYAKIQLKIQQLDCFRAGELEKHCRCGTQSFRAKTIAESVQPDSRTGEQCAIGDESARVVATFNRSFQKTDNSQNSLSHVSTSFDSLIKGDHPEKSPWTLSTDTLTDIHDASHPGTALTDGKGLGSVCLPSLVRSHSEPILHLTSANHSEHSSSSRFIIVQEKGYGVNDLSERGRCLFDKGTSLDAPLVRRLQERNSYLTGNFEKLTPSEEESQDSPIFCPNMDETRIGVKSREEGEQEPLNVRKQVFKVHTSIIQPCEKSKVRFSSGLSKPGLPLESGHLLTPDLRPQEYTSHTGGRGPKDKTSGLVSTNFTSSVTSFEGLSPPSNIKKAPVITSLKHGSARGRPKVVRIVTPNDNINDKSITGACEGSRRENYFSVGRQSATETQEMNMRLPNRLVCNQTYLVKIPTQPWRTKENKDEIFYPCDGYSCSEYPSLVRPPKTSSLVTACELVTSDLRFSPLGSHKNDPCPTYPTEDTVGGKVPPQCVSSDDNPSTNQPQAAENESVAERLERITGYNSATKRNAINPPLPRQLQNFINVRLNSGIRGRIASKRKQFLEAIQSSSGFGEEDDGRQDGELGRLEAFKRSIETERIRLITSTPDLVELERAVRSSRRLIDRALVFKDASQRETGAECASSQRHRPAVGVWPGRLQKPTRYKQICRQEKTLDKGSKSTAYLETDIDTLESRLVRKTNHFKPRLENYTGYAYRARSMLTLADRVPKDQNPVMEDSQRARSMDFLLDDDNRLAASPPENTLNAQKTLSELELRIERSLENLTLPDWYKNSPWSKQPQRGIFLKRDEGRSRPRWQGLGSRTSSSSSLVSASFSRRYLTTKDHVFSTDWRSVASLQSSRESLTGFSVGSVSPANSYPLSRWSSWRSSTTSATVPGWSPYRSFRQPYLGWRAAAGHTSSSSFSAAPSPSPSTPPSNSRSASPGRILEDSKLTDMTRTPASPHRQGNDVEESCLLTSLGGHLDRCDHSTGTAKKGPEEASPPMYHLTGDTEMRNHHNGSYETGSSFYDFGKTGSPLQYPKVADDSSPERQLSSSLQSDSPHFYSYSVRSGTSASGTNSPAVGTSYEEYPHRQTSPYEEIPFESDLSLHPIHRIESAKKETVHFHSTFRTERKINGISTAGREESTFVVSEDSEPVQKSTLNGEGEWIPKEPSELSRSFMHEFHSWFQSMQEVDIQQGSSPPTHSTYCNSCIPDSTNTIEIRKPEVGDVQRHLTDGNQFKHQSQESPLAQRVMWMESSFMKARPPTTVVVMATEESPTEERNGSCLLSRNDDIHHVQYGPDGAVSS